MCASFFLLPCFFVNGIPSKLRKCHFQILAKKVGSYAACAIRRTAAAIGIAGVGSCRGLAGYLEDRRTAALVARTWIVSRRHLRSSLDQQRTITRHFPETISTAMLRQFGHDVPPL